MVKPERRVFLSPARRQPGDEVFPRTARKAGRQPAAAPAQVISLRIPPLSTFQRLLDATGDREISTTMAFVQMLGTLVRDNAIGRRPLPALNTARYALFGPRRQFDNQTVRAKAPTSSIEEGSD